MSDERVTPAAVHGEGRPLPVKRERDYVLEVGKWAWRFSNMMVVSLFAWAIIKGCSGS